MGDDRFCYLHVPDALASHLLDEEDERLGWDLPDDDIKVPQHLLPSYQDEDDETVLPSASHPSYPYGNPYTSRPLSTSTSSHPSHTTASNPAHHSSLFPSSTTHSTSLATTLPNLQLRQLFLHTAFGEPRERVWGEMGLGEVVRGKEARRGVLREEGEEESQEGQTGTTAGGGGQGEPPAPAGQNAGDHPMSDEEEEAEEGE
ncbi:hypothetical protein BCR35DRAFT_308132 [Leucosporidium creatinivorum]|uniref:Anaphase-promoting complex subunit 13 n=1 Tax=Leucosporidium creatinivorum TaxID=106004 RepID=A0A1Y2EEA2_9BASI|nr:hypothetical protein BCR35DRAFT_308132 [Leucosporidium creatinivorum]